MPDTPSSAPVTAIAPGATLAGRYRLERRLARGGMAEVWAAADDVLRRPVAVKVLHPHLAADPAFVTRFKREAVAAARLSHPGIVAIFDTCSDGDVEAIVMALVRGASLRQVLDRDGALPCRRAVEIAAHVADALACAHRAGIVHRDVKPGNILLTEDGRVLVTDFGIAKAQEAQRDGADVTDAGAVVGTAKYLAPEQVTGTAADPRTDVFALGVVLYELLTGAVPWEGDTFMATAVARLHTDPLLPRQRRAEIPRAVERVVTRAMARAPEDRYPSAGDLRTALLGLAEGLDGSVDDDRTATVERDPTAVAGGATPTFTQTERSWLLPTLVIVLVAVALGVTGVVVGRTEVGRSLIQGAREAVRSGLDRGPPAPPPAIAGVASFDPAGGDGENDSRLPHLVDGDPSTSWRTERYNSHAAFRGLKDGVGVVLSLEQATELGHLRAASPTQGWSGEVYVADRPLADLQAWGSPVADLTPGEDGASADLGGTEGGAVLLWITDLGDGEPYVEIQELSLRA